VKAFTTCLERQGDAPEDNNNAQDHLPGLDMHRIPHYKTALITLLASLLVLGSASHGANLRLNGAGIHYAVTEEIYIGALFLESPASTADEAINMPGAKRMEMRILAESWRSRAFATMWLQLISINNPLDQVNAMADEVQAFSNILEDKLDFGDSLRIDLVPGQGISIRINDVKVAHIKDEAFFNILLRCWLGKRSPSNDFTRDLLGITDANSDIVDRFDVTLPEAGRKESIAAWSSAKSFATPAVAATPKPVVTAPKPAPTATVAPKPVVATPEPEPVATAQATPEPAAAAPSPTPEPEPAPQPVAVAEAPATPEPEPQPEPVVAKAAPEPAPEPVVTATEAPASQASAVDVAALEKTYRAYILRDTYKKVRYPSRAASRNQEGEVVVSITVKRDGSLVDVNITGKSYPLLNSAAEDAIKSAAPYPAAPDDLPGDSFTFEIPIKFKIPR